MTWLDLTLATPTIGITCEPRLQFPHEMLDALRPALEKWKEKHPNLLFHIPAQQALIEIKIGNGVVCDVLGNAINVSFRYEAKVVESPGELPKLENPNLEKFSTLLATVADVTSIVCEHLTNPPIAVQRIGVVADSRLDASALPPGVRKWLKHLGTPWGSDPFVVSGQVSTNLSLVGNWQHRCHHVLELNESDKPGDVRFRLDFQKVAVGPTYALPKAGARRFVDDTVKDALTYFDRFGSGALKYASE